MNPNWIIGLAALGTLLLNILHTKLTTARIERDAREQRIRYQESTKARVDSLEKEVESLKADRRDMFNTLDKLRESIAGFTVSLKHIEESLRQLQEQHMRESK